MNEGQAIVTVAPKSGEGQAQCEVTVTDTSTAIQDIQNSSQPHKSPVYDTMGRKVTQLIKGHLYIVNGRKFIAK